MEVLGLEISVLFTVLTYKLQSEYINTTKYALDLQIEMFTFNNTDVIEHILSISIRRDLIIYQAK